MLVTMIMLFALGMVTKSLIIFCLFALSIWGYYFLAQNYYVEFEYFYMDEELVISKIVNKSRRKKILELDNGVIKLIAPMNSAELEVYDNLGKLDCTDNNPLNIPYTIVYMNKGNLKRVNIQMNDELYKELKRNMPYKVQCR